MVKATRVKKILSNLKHLRPLIIGIVFLVYLLVLGFYSYRNYNQTKIQVLISQHEQVIDQYYEYFDEFNQSKNTFLSASTSSLLHNFNNLNDFDALNTREADLTEEALKLSTTISQYDNSYIKLKEEDKKRKDLHELYSTFIKNSQMYMNYQTLEDKIYSCFGSIKLQTSNNRLTESINICSQYKATMIEDLKHSDKASEDLKNTNEYWQSYFDYWSYINTVYTSKDKNEILRLENTIKEKYKSLEARKQLVDRELQYLFKEKYLNTISSF